MVDVVVVVIEKLSATAVDFVEMFVAVVSIEVVIEMGIVKVEIVLIVFDSVVVALIEMIIVIADAIEVGVVVLIVHSVVVV